MTLKIKSIQFASREHFSAFNNIYDFKRKYNLFIQKSYDISKYYKNKHTPTRVTLSLSRIVRPE